MPQSPYTVTGKIFHTSTDGFSNLKVRARNVTTGEITTVTTNTAGEYTLDLANWKPIGYSEADTYYVEVYLPNWRMPKVDVRFNNISVMGKIRNFKIPTSYGAEIGTIELSASKLIENILTIQNGQTIDVWRAYPTSQYLVQSSVLTVDTSPEGGFEIVDDMTVTDQKFFSGYIEKIVTIGGHVSIRGVDKLVDLVRVKVNNVFLDTDSEAGKLSELFITLATTYGGMTADSTSVQDSGDATKIAKFICNDANVFERCKKLATALNWQFYYKAETDKVYFEPVGYTDFTTTIDRTKMISVPKWTDDDSQLVNDITVVGDPQSTNWTQTFNGDGNETEFTLTETPGNVEVFVDDVLKEGGIEGASSGVDYYVDKPTKIIKFVVAPGVGVANIQVNYSFLKPIKVHLDDEESKTDYKIREKTQYFSDIKDTNDARTRATKILSIFAQPFVKAIINVRNINSTDLRAGVRVRIIDTWNNKDSWYNINKYTFNYPNNFDIIDVGNKEINIANVLFMTEDRIKRLEEEMLENTDVIIDVKRFKKTVGMTPVSHKIYTRAINDSFILGHSNNAILGTSMLGDRRGAASTVYEVFY